MMPFLFLIPLSFFLHRTETVELCVWVCVCVGVCQQDQCYCQSLVMMMMMMMMRATFPIKTSTEGLMKARVLL